VTASGPGADLGHGGERGRDPAAARPRARLGAWSGNLCSSSDRARHGLTARPRGGAMLRRLVTLSKATGRCSCGPSARPLQTHRLGGQQAGLDSGGCMAGVDACITPDGEVTCPYMTAAAGNVRTAASPPSGRARRSCSRCATGQLGGRCGAANSATCGGCRCRAYAHRRRAGGGPRLHLRTHRRAARRRPLVWSEPPVPPRGIPVAFIRGKVGVASGLRAPPGARSSPPADGRGGQGGPRAAFSAVASDSWSSHPRNSGAPTP
jgi:hypothetical protein